MTYLPEQMIFCPYCGEQISVLIDPEDAGDQYIEDCQVCCSPIVFHIVDHGGGELGVMVSAENDAY